MQWLIDALKDIWKNFVVYFDGIVQGFWDYLEKIVNTLQEWFWGIVDYCLGMAWGGCYYIYGLFFGEEGFVWLLCGLFNEFVFWIVGWLLESFPELGEVVDRYSDAFSSSLHWIGMLNLFFPLTESIVLLGIYMGFMFVVLVVRLCFKIVPGMGG